MITLQKKAEVLTKKRATYALIRGSLDRNAPNLESLLGDRRPDEARLVVLDLTNAEYINSEGLSWLEQLVANAESRGAKLRVVAPKGTGIRRMLELMRFDRFVVVVEGIRQALRFGRSR